MRRWPLWHVDHGFGPLSFPRRSWRWPRAVIAATVLRRRRGPPRRAPHGPVRLLRPTPQTLLRAGAAAVAAVPNSTLTVIRSEESGTWKVQMATPDGTEQAMDVSSDGVTVMVGPTQKNENDAGKAKDRARMHAAGLDYRAAVNKMLAIVPNGSITELSLGDTNGTTVWKADVWDSY